MLSLTVSSITDWAMIFVLIFRFGWYLSGPSGYLLYASPSPFLFLHPLFLLSSFPVLFFFLDFLSFSYFRPFCIYSRVLLAVPSRLRLPHV
jgi:hypothetical protein